jgi:dTMP kinase
VSRWPGVFIVFEGIDGSGKTTQIRMLREALERKGIVPVVSREPTDGKWGKRIRDSASTGRLSPQDELDAFLHDRSEHVDTLILPALREGKVVILDRYFYSSIAYQGTRGGNVEQVREIMQSRFPAPDAVLILDADPSLGRHRIAHSRNEEPNEFEDRGGLVQAREVFQNLTGAHIHHINAARTPEAVHADVMRALSPLV